MITIQEEIINYLSTANTLSKEHNIEIVNKWGAEGAAIMLQLAKGEIQTDNPQVKTRALKALTVVTENKNQINDELKRMFTTAPNNTKLHVLSAITKMNEPAAIAGLLAQTVSDETTPPGAALYAARHLAKLKTPEAVEMLVALKNRFLTIVGGNEASPSIQVVNKLIKIANGDIVEIPAVPALKPVK